MPAVRDADALLRDVRAQGFHYGRPGWVRGLQSAVPRVERAEPARGMALHLEDARGVAHTGCAHSSCLGLRLARRWVHVAR